jgi:iron complex transport system ATP-binding protein
MMTEDEPALDTVASGKHAMIDCWQTPRRADRLIAARLLRQVECAYVAARPWSVLSQGERQRVLIARALMAKPRLLILDEPCAGLDPAAREHFLQFIQRLGRRKNAPTLVLVTHHVEEIMPAFTHVLLLKGGCVLVADRKTRVLNSANLSQAFNAQIKLSHSAGRYSMRVSAKPGVVV